ncbi:hypothetical protein CFP56_040568 [Quercus suber]|uniref:Uncharacterized protein n=1 Tax=Quercus suber TaxID=58331 RepID=A0AAW0LN27_QUESU
MVKIIGSGKTTRRPERIYGSSRGNNIIIATLLLHGGPIPWNHRLRGSVIFSLEKLGIMKIASDNDKATKTASQTRSSGPL